MAHPFIHSRLLKCVFALSISRCCIFLTVIFYGETWTNETNRTNRWTNKKSEPFVTHKSALSYSSRFYFCHKKCIKTVWITHLCTSPQSVFLVIIHTRSENWKLYLFITSIHPTWSFFWSRFKRFKFLIAWSSTRVERTFSDTIT